MNEQNVSWVITDGHISVSIENKTYVISRTDTHANTLISALRDKRYDEVPELVSVATKIERYSEGTFKVEDGEVLVDGEAVHGLLATKILEFADADLPYEPLVKFARNVRKNPGGDRPINDLFSFLDFHKHPITEDGCFLAYKKVQQGSLKDIHSGTITYAIGSIIEMPRAECDDDPNRSCSKGLHICAAKYLPNFGSSNDTILKVKVNPRDVVAFPTDYADLAKCRVCQMEVIEIIEGQFVDTLLDGVI